MSAEERKVSEVVTDFVNQPDLLDQAVADLMSRAIDEVLNELGVSLGDVEETQRQMEEREIQITEMECKPSPQLNGYYIYQALKPMAFISWPFLNREGKLMTRIIRFDRTDRVDEAIGNNIIKP
jgi:hypothetical protein